MNKKILQYVFITAIYTIAMIIGTLLDMYFKIENGFTIIVNSILIASSIVIIIKNDVECFTGKFFSRYFLLIIIPLIFAFGLSYAQINRSNLIRVIMGGFLGVFTTVVFEEMHYRVIGYEVFKKDKLYLNSALLLTFIYSCSNVINMIFNKEEAIMIILGFISSFSFGLFLLSIYGKVKNALLPIFCSTLFNYTFVYFDTFSINTHILSTNLCYLLFFISNLFYITVGIKIIKGYKTLEEKELE